MGAFGGGEGLQGCFGETGSEVALPVLLGLQLVDEGHELVHPGNDALLLGEGWKWKLNGCETAQTEVGDVGRLLGFTPKTSRPHVCAKDDQGVLRSNPRTWAKTDQGILKTGPRYFPAIDGWTTDKFIALSFVQQDVVRFEQEPLGLFRREVHFEDVGRVDSCFVHICDPQVWTHIRAVVVLGSPLTPKLQVANFINAAPFPMRGQGKWRHDSLGYHGVQGITRPNPFISEMFFLCVTT